MTPQTLQTLARWCGARLVSGDPQDLVSSVETDSRSLTPGSLFVALRGERFDAHDFAPAALRAGAAALLVSREVAVPGGSGVLRVEDTLTALQSMAAAWRTEWAGLVVGLTGSNGKTSTKDMIRSVLGRRFKVCATAGNLNNHIGLPLTVLSAGGEETHGVFEIGMNHPGEIAPLAAIARPDVAVITNVGTAHIEFMKTREAIALEKGMLAEAVSAEGLVVLNANDSYTPSIAARCRAAVLTAGIDEGDIKVTDVHSSGAGCSFFLHLPDHSVRQVQLGVPGRHMAANAALAAAVGWHFGLRAEEITEGLENATLTHGRLQIRTADGLLFLDDSYNANPDSMRTALETLMTFDGKGKRIAVLGRMGELGNTAELAHRQLGAAAFEAGVDVLCVVGTGEASFISAGFLESGGEPSRHHAFATHAACAAHLRATAGPNDIILVKGSRSSAMENVIHPPSA